MDDLVKQSGLNRHSMYIEFGNKERLFLSCIDYYVIEDSKEVIRILKEEPIGVKNIEAFIHNRVQYVMSSDCKGCLLVILWLIKKLSVIKSMTRFTLFSQVRKTSFIIA